ncbi:MAG: histidine phosphatase family protein [Clostridia bacterium]|nr:histidine phosphatase family protein [Clostridia bacterium]
MAEPIIELELYLVRHGESASNAGTEKNLSEELRHDPPLTEKGQRQAVLLGEYFSSLPLDCVLASGLRRATETGHKVCERQPEGGAHTLEIHKIFTECGTGEDCKGRTAAQIRKDFPLSVAAYGTDEDEVQIYHGKDDTDEQLLARAGQAVDYIRSRFHSGEKVLVAAHAAFDTFMLYAALGLSYEQIFDPTYYNTGITKITFFKEGTGPYGDIHLDYHNSVAHLLGEFPEFKY